MCGLGLTPGHYHGPLTLYTFCSDCRIRRDSVITASPASVSCYLPQTSELQVSGNHDNNLMSAELSFKYSFPQSNRNWTNYKWSQTPQFNRIDLISIKGPMAVIIPMDQTFQ